MADSPDDILKEKALEIILNFKPSEKFSRNAAEEILKLKGEVKKLIATLPKEEQQVLELRYFENIPSDVIAKKLGKTKEEINTIILKSAESVKQNIKKSKGIPENITKKTSGTKNQLNNQKTPFKQTSQAQSKNPPEPSPIAVLIAGIISLSIIAGIFIGVFFLVQNLIVNQLPLINQISSSAISYIQEQTSNNKSLNKVIKNIYPITTSKTITKENLNQNLLKISGSSSLMPLSKRWQNAFKTDYPEFNIELISSDSTKGINNLIQGITNIANSSKPLTFKDQERANENGIELEEHRVALDALIIIVNKKNPIEELSLDALGKIFSHESGNWKSFTSFNAPIHPVAREKGSGTNDFVTQRILEGEDFLPTIERKKSNQQIIELVSKDEGAISFINSINFPWDNENIKYIKIKNYDNSISVSPFIKQRLLDEKALRYGDYPLSHYLYLVTVVQSDKKIQTFIDWVLSPKGQAIVTYSGLIPAISEE